MKRIIRDLDKPLLFISIILFIIGLIMIFSASNVAAYMKYSISPYSYFFRQLVYLVISLIAALFILKFNSKSYFYIFNILIYIILIILVGVLLYTNVVKGSHRWYYFFNNKMSFQPSEFAKIIGLMWMASYFDRYEKNLKNYTKPLFALGITGLIAVSIMFEPDLDTTIIYSAIIAVIFFLSPVSKKLRSQLLLIGMGAIIVFLLVLNGSDSGIITQEQRDRLKNYHEPCSTERYYNSGNQVCNGYIAINNGGLTGVGLGRSTQKYLYLPEAHTDFIFAIIMEELGLIGGVAIFILYFLIVGRIIKIAKDSKSTRGFLISMGVASYIVLHIVVNLGSMFGLMPVTGVPLPFMSYGGSFCMCLVLALTFVQRIAIENKRYKESKAK